MLQIPSPSALIYWKIVRIDFSNTQPLDFTNLLCLTWVERTSSGDIFEIFPRIISVTKSEDNLIFKVSRGSSDVDSAQISEYTVKNDVNNYKVGELAKITFDSIVNTNISNGNTVNVLPYQTNFEELDVNYQA